MTATATTTLPVVNGTADIKKSPLANGVNGHSAQGQAPGSSEQDLSSRLRFEPGPNYTARAVSQVTLPPGAVFARLTTLTPSPRPSYATVQTGPSSHINLNSPLLYVNHSCEPNLLFDMERKEVRVTEKGLAAGDELTYFYPATEWDMEQPFDCACGESACLGWICGAKAMQDRVLARYEGVAPWVLAGKLEQAEQKEKARLSFGIGSKMTLGGGGRVGSWRAVAGGGVV
ncbi:hypothetical protein HDK64DRAFT_115457 [Phyllosticta capitalensis]